MSIVFQNPGLADITALTTFGVNVKESDNPIGYFGTGFKYALAVILRNGGRIELYVGTRLFTFETGSKIIRGKEFDVIWMFEHDDFDPENPPQCLQLGFTTELGKNWEPWMAFRELYCNALDENGRVSQLEGEPSGYIGEGYTTIVVDWPELEKVYAEIDRYFLRGEPHTTLPGALEIHKAIATPFIFYRGVRVYQSLNRVYRHTYNVLEEQQLTEDRTLKYPPEGVLRNFFLEHCTDQELIENVLAADDSYMEHFFNYDVSWVPASKTFLDVAQRLHAENRLANNSAIKRLRSERAEAAEPDPVELDDLDKQRLRKSIGFCTRLGFPVDKYPIVVTESLGYRVLGQADRQRRKIYLAKQVFSMGTKQVAQTLLEEYLHLRHQLDDESRAMQEFLFETVLSLGERVLEEAL